MRQRSSHLARNLWILVWLAVGLIQTWQHFRAKQPTPSPEHDGSLVELRHAHLVEDAGNDGDSFKIAHDGGVNVLRLYFVDCPEKRHYSLVESRLKDQANYFGGLSISQTLSAGATAKAFTEKLLSEQPFTVMTRWGRVYDSERFYAILTFDDGEGLAEKLVHAGLCRIHTRGTMMPDGRSEFDFENHLRAIEHEAKAAKRGAWGMPKRAPTKPRP